MRLLFCDTGSGRWIMYRVTLLIRNNPCLGPYSRLKPRAFWWSLGDGSFLMSEVTLYLIYMFM